MQTPQNSFNITSKHYLDKIDADIVNLVRITSVEQGIKPDPDAKEMVRAIVQAKINQLLPDSKKNELKELKKNVQDQIAGLRCDPIVYKIYDTLKTFWE